MEDTELNDISAITGMTFDVSAMSFVLSFQSLNIVVRLAMRGVVFAKFSRDIENLLSFETDVFEIVVRQRELTDSDLLGYSFRHNNTLGSTRYMVVTVNGGVKIGTAFK